MLDQLRGDGRAAQQSAEAIIALSTEKGYPFWLAWGNFFLGWAFAAQGHADEGVVLLRKSLANYRALGTEMGRAYILALLAEAQGQAGQAEEGLATVAEALAFVDQTEERFYEAEIFRLKGELTLRSQAAGQNSKFKDEAEAEACFHKALDIARLQSARSLELRAATSLARLWQQQGKQAEAHDLLSEIYNWFAEGFDTKDLQDAKGLLDELA